MTEAAVNGQPVSQEVELKYAVRDAGAIRAWLEGNLPSGISAGRRTTRSDEDTYVDTADRALAAAGYGVRLRRRGVTVTLSLKSRGSVDATAEEGGRKGRPASAALHRRVEIEGPATRSLEPGSWPESEARDLLESITHGAPLKLRFVIQQRRAVEVLRSEDGTAELSLDEVRVRSRDAVIGSFTTLEIESKSGSVALLDRLAAALEQTTLVEPEPRSKEAIATALMEGDGVGLPKEGRARAMPRLSVAPPPAGPALSGAASTVLEVAVEPAHEGGFEPVREVDVSGTQAHRDGFESAREGAFESAREGAFEPDVEADGLPGQATERVVEFEPPSDVGVDAGPPAERVPDTEPGPPRLSRFAGVQADDTLATAGRRVLRMHLARMIAAEDGTRTGAVAEDLHKMRVATRRMRAAWRVFDGAYQPKFQRRYVDELREVASALGEVRDLDVQLEGLDSYLETLPEPGALAMAPLVDDWKDRRDAARTRLLRLLDSKAYTRFVEDYQSFVASTGEGETRALAGQPMLVRHTAVGRIWLAYEHVRAHEMAIAWADAEALHALRIDAKRLRYALEFFRDALPSRVDTLIERVTGLQDHLGQLNDADVAARTTRSFLVNGAARLTPASREAIALYLESREAEIVRLRRTFAPVWRRVSGSPFRRVLAYVAASL